MSELLAGSNLAKRLMWVSIPIFILAGLGLRLAGLGFISMDMRYFLIGWYDKLARNGFAELGLPFSNYTPPYLYLLFLITKTAGLLPKVAAIKLLSIFFDLLNAFLIYEVLRIKYSQGTVPLVGAGAFLLLPTILVNSAYWGQCDSIYSFFALASLYLLMKDQPLPALISVGISFSFKAQALFLAPLILLLLLKKRIPWLYIGIVPLVYVLMMIPAVATGRPLVQLLKIYVGQEEKYSTLSMHAPNWYLFIPKSLDTPTTVTLGLIITIIAVLAWTNVYKRRINEFTPQAVLLCAMMSVAFMPFFLPKMHERYFYLADLTSFLMAFYFPQGRGWLLTAGYQLTSGLAYSVFLSESILRMKHVLAGNILFSALFINIALLGFIFSNQWKLTNTAYIQS